MRGAILGDLIGSAYEFENTLDVNFPLFSSRSRFTDDTVLTAATAQAILDAASYAAAYRDWYHSYPQAGYGARFAAWAASDSPEPYHSFGNGSAMRISPISWAFDSAEEVLEQANASASCTHNHPEGVKGAQAAALAGFLARKGASKPAIRQEMDSRFGYDLRRGVKDLRAEHRWDVSCQGTLPAALTVFLESADYPSAIRNAVSIGGDSDTIACITGGIAEAFYGGVPEGWWREAESRLDERLRAVIARFSARYIP